MKVISKWYKEEYEVVGETAKFYTARKLKNTGFRKAVGTDHFEETRIYDSGVYEDDKVYKFAKSKVNAFNSKVVDSHYVIGSYYA